jgi:hypothetical protein
MGHVTQEPIFKEVDLFDRVVQSPKKISKNKGAGDHHHDPRKRPVLACGQDFEGSQKNP